MKVLVLGNDGRAHALVWKLFNSSLASELVCAPGNGGTGLLAPTADLDVANVAAVAHWAFDEGVDVIVPADSRLLQAGLVDEVVSFQIGVCGPPQRSSALFGSRCRTKEFLLRHGLPTAPGRAFDNLHTAEKYLATQPLPLIIKADHPSAGEAVFQERYAALQGLHDLFTARPLEGPNDGVVIESFVPGARVVLSAFADGQTAVPLLPTRLYDRVEEGDAGPLARGLGAHTGASEFARRLGEYLHEKLIAPCVAALARDDLPYWGLLGVDCVISPNGPRLTALRSSMQEGEAQVVLPRLEDDLMPWVQAMIARRLHELPPPRWLPTPTVGIGLIARGYPHHFAVGGTIEGVEQLDEGVLVFHSATENASGLRYIPRGGGRATSAALPLYAASTTLAHTTGGHVLTLVASGATLAGARARALVNAERIAFDGRTFRGDIGAKEFG
ncbi:MAG TPA: phosphoribosylglycinamide synthetase C domain-containing protein [Roseiflexaceae bacterium]|nr:phosphoribosylglycinamide synthetase C domain-containing protein [Roseiflexaceae bacterium]